VVKIGEGTFGEAFKGNGMVLKIVPMGNEHLKVRASGLTMFSAHRESTVRLPVAPS
jgi:hypothetical protein